MTGGGGRGICSCSHRPRADVLVGKLDGRREPACDRGKVIDGSCGWAVRIHGSQGPVHERSTRISYPRNVRSVSKPGHPRRVGCVTERTEAGPAAQQGHGTSSPSGSKGSPAQWVSADGADDTDSALGAWSARTAGRPSVTSAPSVDRGRGSCAIPGSRADRPVPSGDDRVAPCCPLTNDQRLTIGNSATTARHFA